MIAVVAPVGPYSEMWMIIVVGLLFLLSFITHEED